MAVTATPAFTQVPILATLQIATANTNLDGITGTYGTLLTGSTNGTRIDAIKFKAAVTTTAGVIRIFIDNLTNKRLIAEVAVNAIAIGASAPSFEAVWMPESPLIIPSGYIVIANTNNAEAMNLFAIGGNL